MKILSFWSNIGMLLFCYYFSAGDSATSYSTAHSATFFLTDEFVDSPPAVEFAASKALGIFSIRTTSLVRNIYSTFTEINFIASSIVGSLSISCNAAKVSGLLAIYKISLVGSTALCKGKLTKA
jgi:hypothetical protein